MFFSDVNVVRGAVAGEAAETAFGRFPAPGLADGAVAEVVIRPQHVRIDFDRQGSGPLPTVRDGVPVRGAGAARPLRRQSVARRARARPRRIGAEGDASRASSCRRGARRCGRRCAATGASSFPVARRRWRCERRPPDRSGRQDREAAAEEPDRKEREEAGRRGRDRRRPTGRTRRRRARDLPSPGGCRRALPGSDKSPRAPHSGFATVTAKPYYEASTGGLAARDARET